MLPIVHWPPHPCLLSRFTVLGVCGDRPFTQYGACGDLSVPGAGERNCTYTLGRGSVPSCTPPRAGGAAWRDSSGREVSAGVFATYTGTVTTGMGSGDCTGRGEGAGGAGRGAFGGGMGETVGSASSRGRAARRNSVMRFASRLMMEAFASLRDRSEG